MSDSGKFRHLDTELSTALHKIFSGEFERKVILAEEENLKIHDDFLSGRQLAWLMFREFDISDIERGMITHANLLDVHLRGENLQAFLNDWINALQIMVTVPGDDFLEPLFRKQLEKSGKLEATMSLYRHDIMHNDKRPSYQQLMRMLTSFIEDQRRQRQSRSLQGGDSSLYVGSSDRKKSPR